MKKPNVMHQWTAKQLVLTNKDMNTYLQSLINSNKGRIDNLQSETKTNKGKIAELKEEDLKKAPIGKYYFEMKSECN